MAGALRDAFFDGALFATLPAEPAALRLPAAFFSVDAGSAGEGTVVRAVAFFTPGRFGAFAGFAATPLPFAAPLVSTGAAAMRRFFCGA